jgi:glycosyltransferase involved in cell wall biosynthesis
MKISVVMATYNGERYLRGQLDSIIKQTLKPDEVIVCDDSSADSTVEILEQYRIDHQIKFYVNKNRLGLIKNFKNAVSRVKEGNYIALSDQDDVWFLDKLEKCAKALKAIDQFNIPCMVHSDLLYVDAKDNIISPSFRKTLGQHKYAQNLQTLLYGNFVNGCTSLFNPALREGFLAMPDQITLNHDGWMALLAFTFGKVAYLNEPLVKYRKHDSNASIDNSKQVNNRFVTTLKQLVKASQKSDDFLKAQLDTVAQFYECYRADMPEEKRKIFEEFLKLKNAGFLIKKLAFAKIVRQYAV